MQFYQQGMENLCITTPAPPPKMDAYRMLPTLHLFSYLKLRHICTKYKIGFVFLTEIENMNKDPVSAVLIL